MMIVNLWWSIVAVQAEEGMVYIAASKDLPAYWIDIYEYPNQKGIVPSQGMSLMQAKGACRSAGKDLCTAAQWRRACLGKEAKNIYGYGRERKDGLCFQSPSQIVSHSSLMNKEEVTVKSGSYTDCVTEDGIFDMIGNVEEWVLDDREDVGGSLEGGASYTAENYANCTGRYSRMPDYRLTAQQEIFSAGARCCKNTEPLTSDQITLESRLRQKQAQQRASVEYQPDNEIEIAPHLFMDIYEYPNQKGQLAQNFVSWNTANQLCQQHGKRLCTAKEWEVACEGKEGRIFPYGDQYVKGACPIENDQELPSGSHPLCQTKQGVMDMSGGLWEWTATPLEAPVLGATATEQLYEIRGGAWDVEPIKATCHPRDGYPATKASLRYDSLGFRCCRGEEQANHRSWPQLVTCPQDMVAVGYFCIDRYEFPNEKGVVPTYNLGWEEAQLACEQAGKRLCSEAEWSLACGGPSNRSYPYGDVYQSQTCSLRDDGKLGAKVYPSGTFKDCVTPEGIADLSGNLWEWVISSNSEGVLRGAGLHFSAGMGRCRSRAKMNQTSLEQAGFRCCLEPALEMAD